MGSGGRMNPYITRIVIIVGYALCLSCAALMWVVTWLAFSWDSDMAWVILTGAALYTGMLWLGWHPPAQDVEAEDEVLRRRYQ
jgi:hypothetical protein